MIGRTLLIGGVILGIVLAGCGIPESSDVQPVDEEDILFGLADTTSTTTTTTLPPTTSIAATSTTAALETTTTIGVETVELYFVSGGQLRPTFNVSLSIPVTLSQVMAALVAGPPAGDPGIGIRTVIPAKADITVNESGGVAEVDLPEGIYDDLSPTDQRLLFGQITLTMTRRPGIGQVRFTLAGEPTEVFTGGGEVRAAGETVSSDDYRVLMAGASPTSTTTTTTTTTVPETAVPATVAVDAGTTTTAG